MSHLMHKDIRRTCPTVSEGLLYLHHSYLLDTRDLRAHLEGYFSMIPAWHRTLSYNIPIEMGH